MWPEYISSPVAWLGIFLMVGWVFTIEIAIRESILFLLKRPSSYVKLREGGISEVEREELTEMPALDAISLPHEERSPERRLSLENDDRFIRRSSH